MSVRQGNDRHADQDAGAKRDSRDDEPLAAFGQAALDYGGNRYQRNSQREGGQQSKDPNISFGGGKAIGRRHVLPFGG